MANIQFYSILILILNIYHLSNSQYIGLPRDQRRQSAVLKQKIELTCQYTGSDDGEFSSWLKDTENLNQSQANRYEIITTQNETKLIITFHETDANVSRWMVRTQKTGWEYPSECLFGQISLNPSPQRIVTDRKAETVTDEGELIIRRTVKENAVLDCIIEPKLDSSFKSKKSLWEYSLNGTSYGRLPAGVRRSNRTKLIFENLKKSHQGYYRCSLNNQTLTGVLRVKDPYAALWPFLIIVSTVLVLIVLILLFEKRQKDAKKKAAALANDDANNPLVSPSKKATDYENKKQAQNA